MIEDYLRFSFIRYGISLGAKAGVVLAVAYPITVVPILLLWSKGRLFLIVLASFPWYLIFVVIPSSIVGGVGGWTISRILLHTQRYFSRKYAVAVGITVGFLAAVIIHLAWGLVDDGEAAWLRLARGNGDYLVISSLLIDIPSLIAILAAGWCGGKLYDEFVGARVESNVQ